MSQSPRVVEIELPTKVRGDVVTEENLEEPPACARNALGAQYLTNSAGLT